ncbi:MAG: DUF4190 domain-containing protein [Bacteroidia bacterium]|nr:DUF4190 domain-containing protein [Bacteroidia bacterium]
MRKIFNLFWLPLVFLIVISSCNVEKRHYTKGYYISWNKSKSVKAPGSSETAANKDDKAIVLNRKEPLLKGRENINAEINDEISLEASVAVNRITKKSKATRNEVHAQLLKLKALNFKPLKYLPDGPKEPDDEDAMIALIVSIAGFFVVGIIGSIVGLVLANRALKKIKAQPDKYGGEDLASMARVISIIGIILWIIAIILIIAIISVIASMAI